MGNISGTPSGDYGLNEEDLALLLKKSEEVVKETVDFGKGIEHGVGDFFGSDLFSLPRDYTLEKIMYSVGKCLLPVNVPIYPKSFFPRIPNGIFIQIPAKRSGAILF